MANPIEYCPWCRKEHNRSKGYGVVPPIVDDPFDRRGRLFVDDPFNSRLPSAERTRQIRDLWDKY